MTCVWVPRTNFKGSWLQQRDIRASGHSLTFTIRTRRLLEQSGDSRRNRPHGLTHKKLSHPPSISLFCFPAASEWSPRRRRGDRMVFRTGVRPLHRLPALEHLPFHQRRAAEPEFGIITIESSVAPENEWCKFIYSLSFQMCSNFYNSWSQTDDTARKQDVKCPRRRRKAGHRPVRDGQQDSVLSRGQLRFPGVWKRGVSETCYPMCTKTTDKACLRQRQTFTTGVTAWGMTTHHDLPSLEFMTRSPCQVTFCLACQFYLSIPFLSPLAALLFTHPVGLTPHPPVYFPPETCFFSAVDLSILLDSESQHSLVFTWKNQQDTWTVLPPGYTESPTYFSQILKISQVLYHLPTSVYRRSASLYALPPNRPNGLYSSHILALKQHKVTKEKLQFCQPSI